MIQGSILNTTLLSIFIDPLLLRLSLLADAKIDNLKVLVNLEHVIRVTVQNEISIVYNWSRTTEIPLLIEKSVVIHYYINNSRNQYYYEERKLPSLVAFEQYPDATYGELVATVA